MEKTLKNMIWALSLILIFSTLFLQGVSAETKKDVVFKGKWNEGARSISSDIPVSAFIAEGVLSLHCRTQRSDITICISKEGEIVYEETAPASMTDCVIIDLTEFGEGDYIIELRNQWGDYLWGEMAMEL